jgi:hypothetical protein
MPLHVQHGAVQLLLIELVDANVHSLLLHKLDL